MPDISPKVREFARQIFEDEVDRKPCQDCGGVHLRVCPRLQSVRTVANDQGVMIEREVTYWAPGTWEKYQIIWPEDAYDDDAGSGDNPAD